jgi:ABC-type Mn2+/Zn2+ transport system ATPase subunit
VARNFTFYLDPVPGRKAQRPSVPGDWFVLRTGDWDDYGFKTLFHCSYFTTERQYEIGDLRILIEGHDSTLEALAYATGASFDAWLESPHKPFISLGGTMNYYRALDSALSKTDRDEVLTLLHDAVFIQRRARKRFQKDLALRESPAFSKSLLRSLSEKQAFDEASAILFQDPKRRDRSFAVDFDLIAEPHRHSLSFDFTDSRIYPSNVNTIIGVNGTGKTQALKAIVAALIDHRFFRPDDVSAISELNATASTESGFSQIVAVSYSPFEDFPRSREGIEAQAGQYIYSGFRTIESGMTAGSIMQEAPTILNTLHRRDTQEFIANAPLRVDTFVRAMGTVIDFDSVIIRTASRNVEIWSRAGQIAEKWGRAARSAQLVFRRADVDLRLSAGQTIFVALLLSVLNGLRRNALLLIDEPELYLHPNMEVQFVELLRELMSAYDAFAIIATHSMIVARETPRERCWILRRDEDNGITADRPPFQTFGADLTRIGNYVFDDAFVSHPYLDWLRERIGSSRALNNLLDADATPELRIVFHSIGQ